MPRIILALVVYVGWVAFPVFADGIDLPPCEASPAKKTQCKIDIVKLHPTQFAVGMRMVDKKMASIEAMSHHEREKYLLKHLVPVVVGLESPKGGLAFYMTDHHHLAFAVLNAGHSKVAVEIIENWEKFSYAELIGKMEKNHFLYLFDENGKKSEVEKLPEFVYGLKDDPYRSLSAEVREQGGYDKTEEYFAEFIWADFFRSRVKIGEGEGGFEKAITKALGWAQSPEAKNLPGYNGSKGSK